MLEWEGFNGGGKTRPREGALSFSSWRGVVGVVKPTMRPGSLEEMIRILPEGIGVVPVFLNIKEGTTREFDQRLKQYDPVVAQFAEMKVDLIHPEGAPPFMLLGHKGEAKLLGAWEKKHKIPIFTSGTNHIRALKALGIKRFVGASYFTGAINDTFANYFREAGFDVLAMEGIDVAFNDVGKLSAELVYAHVKKAFLKHARKAQGIYLLGSGWRVMSIIDTLEQDLGVPVIHPVPARCWEIQRRLHVNQPVKGYGRLLAEMIPG
jgi:maleate cis-trans isomerase